MSSEHQNAVTGEESQITPRSDENSESNIQGLSSKHSSTASLRDAVGQNTLWPSKADDYELQGIIGVGATATVHKVSI
uniref:Uncharacterized protein n=1 Tax=Panagrolaimus davidi TaxID=227884 RepID=A0A914Q975_9BILA